MRRKVIALLATGLMTVGIALPAPAATGSDFAGQWISTDAADGSNQLLRLVAQGPNGVKATLFDDGGSIACGDVTIPVIAIGEGDVSGDDLTIDYRVKCLDGTPASTATVVYTLQPDGTLTENITATVWTR
jgi:hypothetical protein